MEENGFVKAEISSFLYNAGITGLHFLLKTMEAREGSDYRIEKNALLVSKAFLAGRDITQDYIDAHIKKFRKDAAFTHICHEIDEIASLTKRYAEGGEKAEEALDKKYKYILNNTGLTRSSYLSGMAGLGGSEDVIDLKEECKKIKEIKDLREKQRQAAVLKERLMRPKVREMLLMKDIIYSRINALWSNKAFLNATNSKKSIYDVFEKDFAAPLKTYLLNDKKTANKKAKTCIECDCALSQAFEISFLNDTTDDMTRKRSSYWNYKPDSYLCPFCAFVYALAPLGFDTLGKDLIFINANVSVENLIAINGAVEGGFALGNNEEKENQKYHLILNRIVQSVITGKLKEQKNIQVVVRDKINERYKFSLIARDILEVLQASMRKLEKLHSYTIEISPKHWLNVYQQTIFNILNRSNQYGLLHTVLRHSLKEQSGTGLLMEVVKIQIEMAGGREMEQNNADNAFYRGRELREYLCGDKAGAKDADNKLRGFVFQLLNALQTQNREKFWYLAFKMYSGLNLPIPQIFLKTFKTEEELQYLGFAFILGLKNEKYIAEDKKEEATVNG